MIEPTLLQIGKKIVFLEVFEYLTNGFYVSLAEIFDVDQDVVQIYNNKDIKLFGQDLIDVTLEGGRSIEETKGHNLVLKMPIPSSNSHFPLVTFSDLYLMICVD